MEHKFKKGDIVKVVQSGSGFGTKEIGRILTIKELTKYASTPGYTFIEPYNNSHWNDAAGEDSFILASKEEKIAEANKRYPKGTVYHPAHLNTVIRRTCTSGGNFEIVSSYIQESSGNYKKNGHSYSESVFYKGKWAKIISKPVEKEVSATLQEGTYWVVTSSISSIAFKENYVFKQRMDYSYLKVEKDLRGCKNGLQHYTLGSGKIRIATTKEAELYENRGKPSDITEMYVFNKYMVGEKVRSLVRYNDRREIGDIFTVLDRSTYGNLYYKEGNSSSSPSQWEFAKEDDISKKSASEKIKPPHKFKVGEAVEVITGGYGLPPNKKGKIVTIKEQGFYKGNNGYIIEESLGNSIKYKNGKYQGHNGFIGEKSFEKLDTSDFNSSFPPVPVEPLKPGIEEVKVIKFKVKRI